MLTMSFNRALQLILDPSTVKSDVTNSIIRTDSDDAVDVDVEVAWSVMVVVVVVGKVYSSRVAYRRELQKKNVVLL